MVLDLLPDVLDQLRGCIYQLDSSWLKSNEVMLLCYDVAKSVCKCGVSARRGTIRAEPYRDAGLQGTSRNCPSGTSL